MKRQVAVTAAALLFYTFLSVSVAQEAGKLLKRFVTLPCGEIIPDLNGHWDANYEMYGPWQGQSAFSGFVAIEQKKDVVIAINRYGNTWMRKGKPVFKGQLCKNGFKTVQVYIPEHPIVSTRFVCWEKFFVWEPANWRITHNGDKMFLNCGGRMKITLRR